MPARNDEATSPVSTARTSTTLLEVLTALTADRGDAGTIAALMAELAIDAALRDGSVKTLRIRTTEWIAKQNDLTLPVTLPSRLVTSLGITTAPPEQHPLQTIPTNRNDQLPITCPNPTCQHTLDSAVNFCTYCGCDLNNTRAQTDIPSSINLLDVYTWASRGGYAIDIDKESYTGYNCRPILLAVMKALGITDSSPYSAGSGQDWQLSQELCTWITTQDTMMRPANLPAALAQAAGIQQGVSGAWYVEARDRRAPSLANHLKTHDNPSVLVLAPLGWLSKHVTLYQELSGSFFKKQREAVGIERFEEWHWNGENTCAAFLTPRLYSIDGRFFLQCERLREDVVLSQHRRTEVDWRKRYQ